MGDCPEHRPMNLGDAQRLEAAGYEIVTQGMGER
jgi:hypothetical protein